MFCLIGYTPHVKIQKIFQKRINSKSVHYKGKIKTYVNLFPLNKTSTRHLLGKIVLLSYHSPPIYRFCRLRRLLVVSSRILPLSPISSVDRSPLNRLRVFL